MELIGAKGREFFQDVTQPGERVYIVFACRSKQGIKQGGLPCPSCEPAKR